MYDAVAHLELTEEQRSWRVTEQDIADALALLGRDHAYLDEVDTVQTGDTVRCTCVAGPETLQQRTVLLYPGRVLSGATAAETDVLGLGVGAQLETKLGGVYVTDYQKSNEENAAARAEAAKNALPVTLRVEKSSA